MNNNITKQKYKVNFILLIISFIHQFICLDLVIDTQSQQTMTIENQNQNNIDYQTIRLNINDNSQIFNICSNNFGIFEGNTACKQVGFQNGLFGLKFDQECKNVNYQYYNIQYQCQQEESNLFNCSGIDISDDNYEICLSSQVNKCFDILCYKDPKNEQLLNQIVKINAYQTCFNSQCGESDKIKIFTGKCMQLQECQIIKKYQQIQTNIITDYDNLIMNENFKDCYNYCQKEIQNLTDIEESEKMYFTNFNNCNNHCYTSPLQSFSPQEIPNDKEEENNGISFTVIWIAVAVAVILSMILYFCYTKYGNNTQNVEEEDPQIKELKLQRVNQKLGLHIHDSVQVTDSQLKREFQSAKQPKSMSNSQKYAELGLGNQVDSQFKQSLSGKKIEIIQEEDNNHKQDILSNDSDKQIKKVKEELTYKIIQKNGNNDNNYENIKENQKLINIDINTNDETKNQQNTNDSYNTQKQQKTKDLNKKLTLQINKSPNQNNDIESTDIDFTDMNGNSPKNTKIAILQVKQNNLIDLNNNSNTPQIPQKVQQI